MRDLMQTNGKRARLRSTASTGRPFFRLPYDRMATFEQEIESIEDGSHQRLQEGLADIQRRKADLIASAEAWRNDRILNIENEFDGAVKAAIDQYNEDVRSLRNRLVDEVKRNRRRYVDTNGLSSPQMQRKKARMPSTMQAASTRSSAAAQQSNQKPVNVRIKLSDDEIRSDLKKITKPFAPQPPTSPRHELIRVEDDVLYIGNIKFEIGSRVHCGRHGERRSGLIDSITSTEVAVLISKPVERYVLPLSYIRTGMGFIEHDDAMQQENVDHQARLNEGQHDAVGAAKIVVGRGDSEPTTGGRIPESDQG